MTDISENKTNVLLLKLPFFCVAEFKMTGTDPIDINNQKIVEDINEDNTHEDPEQSDAKEENTMPSPHEEEAAMKKKYGGMLPKKPPLISKDHERAFFDSADWALGKQGAPQKPKGPLEALRPKLQPTPQQQARSRRSAYAPSDNGEDDASNSPGSED